jgi:steroid 5-alpha reductase family enzyme
VVAGEKAGLRPICCGTGNFGVKPGLVEGVFQNVLFLTTFSGISMNILVVEALVSMALALSGLMAMAWVVQQRAGNSGWVDTIWIFALRLAGAGSAPWPVANVAPDARQWLVAAWSLRLRPRGDRFRDYQWRTSMFVPLPPRHGATR